jgi:hypothetical protein
VIYLYLDSLSMWFARQRARLVRGLSRAPAEAHL